jgi:hypothetical protein
VYDKIDLLFAERGAKIVADSAFSSEALSINVQVPAAEH